MHRRWLQITLLAFIVGCGRGDGITRVEVVGTVRHRGEPVADGQIRFIPEGNTAGPLTIERITQGRYECTYKGGLPVGTHRVAILSWDPNTPPPMAPLDPPRRQFLPPKYNQKSELTWTLEDQSGPVMKDFDLN